MITFGQKRCCTSWYSSTQRDRIGKGYNRIACKTLFRLTENVGPVEVPLITPLSVFLWLASGDSFCLLDWSLRLLIKWQSIFRLLYPLLDEEREVYIHCRILETYIRVRLFGKLLTQYPEYPDKDILRVGDLQVELSG